MMLGMLLQPHPVALEDASQRFCVMFQPHCNLAVSDPAQDGRRGQLMPHNEEAGDATGCAARILTASGALGAADACTGRALGRAIPLAGRGEGWSAPQLPLAHLTKSPRSLLVPVGDFISRTRSLRRSKPGHDRNAVAKSRAGPAKAVGRFGVAGFPAGEGSHLHVAKDG